MKTYQKKSISITIPEDILLFLLSKSKKTISASISNILQEYYKFCLQKELMEDAKTDIDDVMSDFADYLSLTEKNA